MSLIETHSVEVSQCEAELEDAANPAEHGFEHDPSSISSKATFASPSTKTANGDAPNPAGAPQGTPVVQEFRHVCLYLGEGACVPHWDPNGPAVHGQIAYVAIPADNGPPFFVIIKSSKPLTAGQVYSVAARHSDRPRAIRDPKVIPVKVRTEFGPCSATYLPIKPMTREQIMSAVEDKSMFAFFGMLATTPSKEILKAKDGRDIKVTNMSAYVLDDENEMHMIKMKMWGHVSADIKKGTTFRAIGIPKSVFQGEVTFGAVKLTNITWSYKDPRDRAEVTDITDLKDAVAKELEEDEDVIAVDVVMGSGAAHLVAAAGSAFTTPTRGRGGVKRTPPPTPVTASSSSSSASSSSAVATARKGKKLKVDSDDDE